MNKARHHADIVEIFHQPIDAASMQARVEVDHLHPAPRLGVHLSMFLVQRQDADKVGIEMLSFASRGGDRMAIKQIPRGPDFIVIGAQRSGTTWLHRVLSQHPQLWLTPVKELHYFDRLLKDDVRWPRTLMSGRHILNPWHLQYLFGKKSDDWYARLFHGAQRKGLVAGEVTPAYATLDRDSFHRIRSVNADVKLIFTMRDPVERTWSAVNMWGKRYVGNALDRARLKPLSPRSAYTKTISRLMAVFPRAQLHFSFFDDLCDRPKDFVIEILSFLGVTSDCVDNILVKTPVNSAARGKPVPIEFRRKMAEAYLPMVRDLGELFSGPPVRWRRRYEQLLKGSQYT